MDMRAGFIILANLLFAALIACADETLPTLKVSGEVYTNVTITSVTARNIYFTFDKGMGSAKLKDLDPALQKHFHYDAGKAAAEEKTQKASSAAALSMAGAGDRIPENADAKAVMDDAIARVKAIVNQPVRSVPFTRDMQNVGTSQYWFHQGAEKPDYDNADIRKTQDCANYAKYDYVTSDLNPGIVFPGKEVEFNSMTKYFYTDRSLPKKKLSEAEMLEINRLYRIIGQCETKLGMTKYYPVPETPAAHFLSQNRTTIIGVAGGLLALLLIIRLLQKSA